MVKADLTIELYKAFRPYVQKSNIVNYDDTFLKRKIKNEKLIKDLIDKFIDLDFCSRNPKKPHDILIINYVLVELPSVGLISTKLFKDYLRKEKQYRKKNVG